MKQHISEREQGRQDMQAEIERLRAALEKIANSDYRGNRTTCQVWAREALMSSK